MFKKFLSVIKTLFVPKKQTETSGSGLSAVRTSNSNDPNEKAND